MKKRKNSEIVLRNYTGQAGRKIYQGESNVSMLHGLDGKQEIAGKSLEQYREERIRKSADCDQYYKKVYTEDEEYGKISLAGILRLEE